MNTQPAMWDSQRSPYISNNILHYKIQKIVAKLRSAMDAERYQENFKIIAQAEWELPQH